MTLEQLYHLRDDFHQRIDDAFDEVESCIPKDKDVSADITDIAKDAWELWKQGIGEISQAAGRAYAEYVDGARP